MRHEAGLKSRSTGKARAPLSGSSPIKMLSSEVLELVPLEVLKEELLKEELLKEELLKEDDPLKRLGSFYRKAPALGCHLVSRAFRDMSYRPLGLAINATTFDMCSRDSMDSLEVVSKCEQLAPWITRLNFTCAPPLHLDPDTRLAGKLSPEAVRKLLKQMRTEEEGNRYPKTWPTKKMIETEETEMLGYQSRDRALERALTAWMKRFTKLESASFLCYKDRPPARYSSSLASVDTVLAFVDDQDDRWNRWERWGFAYSARTLHAHIGLQTLFSSLTASDTHVQCLDLAVEMLNLHRILIDVPQKIVAAVCKEVKELSLAHCYDYPPGGSDPDGETKLTQDLFPALRTLTVDRSMESIGVLDYLDEMEMRGFSLPVSQRSVLSSLSVTAQGRDSIRALKFIECYGHNAKHVILRFPDGGNPESMLEVLERLRPAHFTLHFGDEDYWDTNCRQFPFASKDHRKLLAAYKATESGIATALGSVVHL